MSDAQSDHFAKVSDEIRAEIAKLEVKYDTRTLAAMLTVRSAVLWNLLYRAKSESKSNVCDIYSLALGTALEPGPVPQIVSLHNGEPMTKQ